MQKVNLTINGVNVEAEKGKSVLKAALDAGIYIPNLCSHPDLTPQGGCKLCVVEIDGVEGAVTSCTTEVQDGMKIRTKSDNLSKLRNMAMELMLASHPADCTSCPVYLNCELQAMIQYLGTTHSKLRTITKNNAKLNTNNPLIIRDMERCIQCGRCVRACSELRNVGILDYNKKDGETYVSTKGDLSLIESNCRFCGACIEVCPTGALRDVEGVFKKGLPRELALIPCTAECPANIDVPAYIRYVKEGKNSEAVGVIREKVPFPLSLGYVCSRKCETACKREKLNEPISIRNIKRYASENDKEKVWKEKALKKQSPTGKKVAVVGAGPAGMTAAYYLAKKGHAVTIYEKLPVAGGMLSVGIPEYRIPRQAVQSEVDFIKETGVELILNTEIKSLSELKEKGFDSVLIAVGTHAGRKLPIPGSGFKKVYSAVDFLRKVSLKEEIEIGKKVVVLGGGNVAFDCARSAKRYGAESVELMCLEARDKMLADLEEIEQGEEEGIVIRNSRTFISIEGTDEGPTGVKYMDIKCFRFDEAGRLNIETDENCTEKVTEADTVIFAAGQSPGIDAGFGVDLVRGNLVAADCNTLQSSIEGVFAAGDVVYGTKFVISAIASGRQAASSIDKYLGGDGAIDEVLVERQKPDGRIGKKENFAGEKRKEPAIEEVSRRACGFCQVDLGFTGEQAVKEAERCLQCDLRTNISKIKFWGDYQYK